LSEHYSAWQYIKRLKEELKIRNLFKRATVILSIIAIAFLYQSGWKKVSASEAAKSFNYTCIAETSIAGTIDIDMKVTPKISIPDSVEPNGELILDNIATDIEIDLTGNLDGLRALINPFNGHVNHFNIEANGQTVNVVGKDGAKIPETAHGADDNHIPFKVSGNKSSFSAGTEDINVHVGEIEAVINAKLGATPIDLTVVCSPPGDNVLTAVSVDGQGNDDDQGNDDGQGNDDNKGGVVGQGGDDGNDNSGVVANGMNKSGTTGGGYLLPKTATNTPLLIAIGSILSIAGGAILFIRRKIMNE